jgi:hypothetical protein
VANLHPDPAQWRLPDRHLVPRDDEAVDAEKRQMRLAVDADEPLSGETNTAALRSL